MFRRIRGRLDRMEAQASATMGDARDMVALAKALIEDLQDGVTLNLVVGGKEIPIEIRIDPREET